MLFLEVTRIFLAKALQQLVADENITLNSIKEAGTQITIGSEQVANASQALAKAQQNRQVH